MLSEIFNLFSEGLKTVRSLWGKPEAQAAGEQAAETVDANKAREGTAAGAAANLASHHAGKEPPK